MNYKEINKSIIKAVEFITKNYGFLIRGDRYGLEFYKKNEFIFISFGYSLREDENPDIFEMNTYSKHWLHIAFPQVEKIIHPILVKNKLFGQSITYDEVYSTFSISKKFINEVPNKGIKIDDVAGLEFPTTLLTKFFKEDALPFFDNWNSLPVLYNYIKELPENREVLSDILGRFYQFKKAIIYRLCNDSSALDYINNYYERRREIFSNYPEEIAAERYCMAAKELKEILETTKPIYNTEV